MGKEKAIDGTQTVSQFLFGQNNELKTVLHELASSDSYWDTVETFVLEKEETEIRSLSTRDRNWVSRIKNELTNEFTR